MEKYAVVAIPENFREAYDDFMVNNLHVLQNVFIAFRYAALWKEENPSLEGPSWSTNLECVVRNMADSLGITAKKLADAARGIAPKSSRADVAAASDSFLNEVSKLFDLLAMFEIVGEDEDESGHREEVHWSNCFEVLLDSFRRIEEASDKLWNILVETPMPPTTAG